MHLNLGKSTRRYPFVRLLIALIIGIIAGWYFSISPIVPFIGYGIAVFFLIGFNFLSSFKRFKLKWLPGIMIFSVFVFTGMLTTWQQNIQNNNQWYGKSYTSNDDILATINEPPVEKTNSYKALATIDAINKNGQWLATKGNVLVYLKKDSSTRFTLHYGSRIVFKNTIQSIQNNGNPAAFNYNRYCLFQSITGQVFLSSKDYRTLSGENINSFQQLLFTIRDWALNVLKQNIHSQKELGIAEALLIGYRNDLDRDLVQAYSNTGVVHIIAISGLHIGIIYTSLLMFFSLFRPSKTKKIIQPVFILLIIWLFTLIAGAAPSVLRSAVMFTCIIVGKFLNKNGNIYNTLAASAFILLIINPFYLWDVGFQLSYTAVVGIVMFYKHVNNWFYFKNLLLRKIWQLSAVSLSAQVFTLPLVVYHFHQIPLLFLFSNIVAVPLSGIILFEELILFCISWWHTVAASVGNITELSIKAMNNFIEHINGISFSVWDGLHISIIQLLLMFTAVILGVNWLLNKSTKVFIPGLICILLFFILRDADIIYHKRQQKMIVYNVQAKSAADFISGSSCYYAGDPAVLTDAVLNTFNIKYSRTKDRVYKNYNEVVPDTKDYILRVGTLKILMLDDMSLGPYPKSKIRLDALILSQNFKQTPQELNNIFDCKYIVADASVPLWKSAKWKKDFEQLHLRFYSVAQQGAFILKF
jgi:competence protein ComEC